MPGVSALRACGRSMVHHAIEPSRSNRSAGVPSSWAMARTLGAPELQVPVDGHVERRLLACVDRPRETRLDERAVARRLHSPVAEQLAVDEEHVREAVATARHRE